MKKILVFALLGIIYLTASTQVYAYEFCGPDGCDTEPVYYSIIYYENGGSSMSNISRPAGSTVYEPTDPTKPAYVFVGWYSNSSLTTPYSFPGVMPSSTLRLYAKWEFDVTILTYDVPNLLDDDNDVIIFQSDDLTLIYRTWLVEYFASNTDVTFVEFDPQIHDEHDVELVFSLKNPVTQSAWENGDWNSINQPTPNPSLVFGQWISDNDPLIMGSNPELGTYHYASIINLTPASWSTMTLDHQKELLLHEIGHGLGLRHPNYGIYGLTAPSDSVMLINSEYSDSYNTVEIDAINYMADQN